MFKKNSFKVETKKQLVSASVVAILLCSLGSADAVEPQTKIIGGENATIEDNPWLVALVEPNQPISTQFCAGSIVAERWVLTAAHCVYDAYSEKIEPSDLNIVSGVTNLFIDNPVDRATVTNIIVHPDYNNQNPDVNNDLALIEVANNLVMPSIAMYQGGTNELLGTDAIIAGWGVVDNTNPSAPIRSGKLQSAVVPIVPLSFCNGSQSYDGTISLGQICAGFQEGGVDSCQGDSGGPMVSTINGTTQLVGIVSFGFGCGIANFYGVYSSVGRYQVWISAYISGAIEPDAQDKNYILRGSDIESSGSLSIFGLLILSLVQVWRKYNV